MDSAELLVFLKSDNFAQDAMGYVKSVASENKTESNDGNESSDMLVKAIEQNESENDKENSTDNNVASNRNDGAKGTFVNDILNTEKELKKAILKVEQEVRNLTESYEQIMNIEGSVEEKTRLSQPVYKELKDKYDELIQLKSQLKNLNNEKFTAMKTA